MFRKISAAVLVLSLTGKLFAQPEASIAHVTSKDGTPIAIECAGSGPNLVIVHGGTGDRTRWKPLFPFLAAHFIVCAMDRRGHGESGDSPDYSLKKGAEDVAAVVNSRPAPVFVLGHSLGGVCALEAAFLTDKIARLVLYEPPVQESDRTALANKMENLIRGHEPERALLTFLQEIVMVSPGEIAAMKARPSWPARVAGVARQIREIRALDQYHFDAKKVSALKIPTLLLTGSKTASPDLKRATEVLMATLPNRKLIVFEGQEHNAMDNIPQEFAETVTKFLLDAKNNTD
jgi:pimeloyl-ACP methyl ester carboxylesterase